MEAGAIALAGNTTLTSLQLADSLINDQGAIALAGNTSLTSLGLSRNQIGDSGAKAFASNTTLTTLDLANNSKIVNETGYIAAIERNRQNWRLHLAAEDMSPAALKECLAEDQLLQRINQQNINGNTPLHIACMYERVDNLRLLLQAPGINLHVPDKQGDTPLLLAAKHGHDAVVAGLLRCFIDNEEAWKAEAATLAWAARHRAGRNCATSINFAKLVSESPFAKMPMDVLAIIFENYLGLYDYREVLTGERAFYASTMAEIRAAEDAARAGQTIPSPAAAVISAPGMPAAPVQPAPVQPAPVQPAPVLQPAPGGGRPDIK